MPPHDLNDYKYWRGQAAELRAKADRYKNKFAAEALRKIANDYEAMAERAEDRIIHGIDLPMRRPIPEEKNP